jgi:DNA polymerase I-like protein with 3'-5' exonuclease and polymerase domains
MLGLNPESVTHDIQQITKAKDLMALYFEKLPAVQKWIHSIKSSARINKVVESWCGMPYLFDSQTYYKAPNAIIQGGTARVINQAMINIDEDLSHRRSRLLLQVHDELVFEIHESEVTFMPAVLQEIMQRAYPFKHLPLTCGIDYSYRSWQDKKPWSEHGKEARDKIQGTIS